MKISAILGSTYLLLFGAVVAHLIFNLDTEFVWIFCWQVDRLTMLVLTLVFLGLAYIILLLISILSYKKRPRWLLLLHIVGALTLITGMAILDLALNTELENRLVIFDSALLIIVISWSIEFYIALRTNMR
jgi:hypothetical protein